MSAWWYLVIAGLLETGWALGLKYTEGFTRLVPSLLTTSGIVASMWFLSLAARTLPMGTAYALWVGMGATGTVLAGAIFFQEPLSPLRVFFLGLLIVALVGFKLTSPSA